MSKLAVALLSVACFVFASGCGGGGNTISGTVTSKGKPLTTGLITFHFDDGKKADGTIQPEGTYVVKGAPSGTAKVTIDVPKLPAEPVKSDAGKQAPPKPVDAKFAPPELPKGGEKEKVAPVPIDAKYADVNTSGLKYEITGSKTINIELP